MKLSIYPFLQAMYGLNSQLYNLKILLQKVDFNPDDTASKMEVLNLEKGKLSQKLHLKELLIKTQC